MKEYFLQVGDAIQKGISGVGQKSAEGVKTATEFGDIPGYTEEKQTVFDEGQVNEAFEPANNIFDGLREGGDWLVNFLSDLIQQIFGNFT